MADLAERQQELEKKFWAELENSPFVMLGLHGVDDSHTRPMTAHLEGRQIWFFASRSDELVKGLQQPHRAIATFADRGHDLFASIHGRLAIDNDPDTIDRLWSPSVAAWYKEGRDDPNIVLIRFEADVADVWETTGGSFLKAAYDRLTGADPAREAEEKHRAEVVL